MRRGLIWAVPRLGESNAATPVAAIVLRSSRLGKEKRRSLEGSVFIQDPSVFIQCCGSESIHQREMHNRLLAATMRSDHKRMIDVIKSNLKGGPEPLAVSGGEKEAIRGADGNQRSFGPGE